MWWFEPPEEYLNRLRSAGMSTDIWSTPSWSTLGRSFHVCVSGQAGFHEVCQVEMEVHMDDVHGFGPDPRVEKFKEDLAAHIWFLDGGVHREGAEYDHLKRFRKRLNGPMTIESNPKYLDAVLELLGLKGATYVPTPSGPEHKEKLTTGELLSPAETTV